MAIHFWATWCTPCVKEIRSLEAFYAGPYRELRKKGLVLLTVNNDVRIKDLRKYLDQNQFSFPIYFDSLLELNDQFELVGLPGTVLVDREGRIVDRMLGAQDWESPELSARIETHLQRQLEARKPTGG